MFFFYSYQPFKFHVICIYCEVYFTYPHYTLKGDELGVTDFLDNAQIDIN